MSAPLSTELRPITCEFCGGDGYFCDDRPIPTPQGPHYGPDVRCTACNGDGEYEVEFVPITEDDVWGAFGDGDTSSSTRGTTD